MIKDTVFIKLVCKNDRPGAQKATCFCFTYLPLLHIQSKPDKISATCLLSQELNVLSLCKLWTYLQLQHWYYFNARILFCFWTVVETTTTKVVRTTPVTKPKEVTETTPATTVVTTTTRGKWTNIYESLYLLFDHVINCTVFKFWQDSYLK